MSAYEEFMQVKQGVEKMTAMVENISQRLDIIQESINDLYSRSAATEQSVVAQNKVMQTIATILEAKVVFTKTEFFDGLRDINDDEDRKKIENLIKNNMIVKGESVIPESIVVFKEEATDRLLSSYRALMMSETGEDYQAQLQGKVVGDVLSRTVDEVEYKSTILEIWVAAPAPTLEKKKEEA